jgi:hypothetical protein
MVWFSCTLTPLILPTFRPAGQPATGDALQRGPAPYAIRYAAGRAFGGCASVTAEGAPEPDCATRGRPHRSQRGRQPGDS